MATHKPLVQWKFCTLAMSEVEFQSSLWKDEFSVMGYCVIEKLKANTYEVAIKRNYLYRLRPQLDGLNSDYNPIQPESEEISRYGKIKATENARQRWLERAAKVIHAKDQRKLKAEEACEEFALLYGLSLELAHATWSRAILVSDAQTQKKIAQNLLLLFLCLENEQTPERLSNFAAKDQKEVFDTVRRSLSSPVPTMTERDKAQRISLLQTLLEFSGEKFHSFYQGWGDEYTIGDNARLLATCFDVHVPGTFGEFDSQSMLNTLSRSLLFSESRINVEHLEIWVSCVIDVLPLGFGEAAKRIPKQIIEGLGHGQVLSCLQFLDKTYEKFPSLREPGNDVMLLLIWSSAFLDDDVYVLRMWASSEEGKAVSERWIQDFQDPQSKGQLILVISAIALYVRLLSDGKVSVGVEQPIKGSYLADLDANLKGLSSQNSERVWEHVLQSLMRVFRGLQLGRHVLDLLALIDNAFESNCQSHMFDGWLDVYLRLRIEGRDHDIACAEFLENIGKFDIGSGLGWTLVEIKGA